MRIIIACASALWATTLGAQQPSADCSKLQPDTREHMRCRAEELRKFQEKAPADREWSRFVQNAKNGITANLKDPGSAQYRGLFVSGKDMPVLCGEINAKNSYGAYVGFRLFYAVEGGAPLADIRPTNEHEAYVFDQMLPRMCGDKIVDVK